MKKRMFLTTVLMTLVLLLAVTTATFAWYSANTATELKNGEHTPTGSLSATDNDFDLGEIVVTVALTPDANSVILSKKSDGYSYVIVNGKPQKDTSIDPYDASMYTKVTASLSFSIQPDGEGAARTPSNDELATAQGTYTITCTAEEYAKISKDSGEEAVKADKGSVVSLTFEIDENGNVEFTDTVFYVAIEGDDTITNGTEKGQVVVSGVAKA